MREAPSLQQTLAIAVLCLLAFFALGSAQLKFFPIGNDEYNSLSHIKDVEESQAYSLSQTVGSVAARSQQHGPLYFLLLNMASKLAGDDVLVLRLFSLYFGLLTVAAACALARACRDRQLGIAALLMTSFLAYHLFYSHTARMYTLLPLAALWLIWSYWRVIAAGRVAAWRWLSLLASAALILYLHYFGIMLLAAIGLYHLIFLPKDRRWWQAALTLALAGLCFLPWLPVAIDGFAHRRSLASTRLNWLDSLLTTFLIFGNGLFFLPLLAALGIARGRRRLNERERFIVFITAACLALTVIANEFTPILVARRMRYMTLLTAPIACSLLIGLRCLPGWRRWRWLLLGIWLAAFAVFSRSEDLLLYANKLVQQLHRLPHYQDFIYEAEHLPGHNELILSFHPEVIIPVIKTLTYYRAALPQYAQVAHISYYEPGQLAIQSNLSTYATPAAIAENATGIWVIHDPQETDLSAVPIYRDWFSQHYQPCRRYIDKARSAIDYYLRADLPCQLVTAADKLSIRYDNGSALDNLLVSQDENRLRVMLRWLRAVDSDYSFSLQIFDEGGSRAGQADRVIAGEPIDIVDMDISSLPAGGYALQLIVYDFETGLSQPGTRLQPQQRFDRQIEVARFNIDA